MNLAITGRMGSGKTTIAEILKDQYGYSIVRISGKLKEIVIDLELPYERDVLQEIGDFFRKFDEIVWVRQAIRKSNDLLAQGMPGIAIDDVRYKNEQRELAKAKFKIIRVYAAEEKRRERIARRDSIQIADVDWKRWSSHPTELEIGSIPVDYEINNDSDILQLTRLVKNVID
ncbi:MAG: AAA family ATPase [Candidatus Hodarchaeales archaeon]|jgi:dephospho-CoA kinase